MKEVKVLSERFSTKKETHKRMITYTQLFAVQKRKENKEEK